MVQFLGWKPGIFLSLRIQPSLCVPCRLGRFTRDVCASTTEMPYWRPSELLTRFRKAFTSSLRDFCGWVLRNVPSGEEERRLHSFFKPDWEPVLRLITWSSHAIPVSLFSLEDKETEKLETSLSFVQHGVAHGAQFWKCLRLYSGFGK